MMAMRVGLSMQLITSPVNNYDSVYSLLITQTTVIFLLSTPHTISTSHTIAIVCDNE